MEINKDYIEYVYKVYDYLYIILEKGFEEYKILEFVLKEFEKMGFENINKGIVGIGIIVIIDFKKEGLVFVIRVDMDVLEFIIDGEKKMIYVCGYDGYIFMFLIVVKLIKERNLVKRGKLKIFF